MKYFSFVAACFFMLAALSANAQYKSSRKKPGGSSDGTQWWVGLKAGMNLTNPQAGTAYDIFSFTQQPFAGNAQRQYDRFRAPGTQFGVLLGFEFIKGFQAVLQPQLVNYHYSYAIDYYWASEENPNQNVRISYEHEGHLQYLELPLAIRYQLMHDKLKPYVQAGAYWGRMMNATKDVTESITDNAAGATVFEENKYAGRTQRLFEPSNWGLFGGIGATYNVGNARVGLEVNYKMGMKNITNSQSRFEDTQFVSGTFDAQDDLKLHQLDISFVIVMPLKFITSKDYVPL